jgi:hypothetical protein
MRKEVWIVAIVLIVALGLWFVAPDDVLLSRGFGSNEVMGGGSGQAKYDPTGGSNLKKPGDSVDPNAVPSQFDGFCYDTVTNSRVNIMEVNFLEKNCRIKVDGCIGLIDEGSLNDPADLIPCVGGDCYLFSDCDNGEECCSGATTGSCYKSASGIIGPIDSSIYEVCCGGEKYAYRQGFECCGNDYINIATQGCCGGIVFGKGISKCCNNEYLAGAEDFNCCNDSDCSDGMACCQEKDEEGNPIKGGECYDPNTEGCCTGGVFGGVDICEDITDQCCDGVCNPADYTCCGSDSISPISSKKCCGGVAAYEIGVKCCANSWWIPVETRCCEDHFDCPGYQNCITHYCQDPD